VDISLSGDQAVMSSIRLQIENRQSQIENHKPPIIGAICAFDAKIYKNVGGFFDVTSCWARSKKNFQISGFCFQLPSLLVDFLAKFYLN
jgi:hypothetical protein